MQKRKLGHSGLNVSALGYGAMGLSSNENTGAADVRFTSSEIAELNVAVRALEIKGQRLPDAILPLSGLEAPPKK